ncbi:MAG: hypothetical protein LC624_06955 [Halobacteriales archaeon]|nr:hypothetical protein [Halobacteriales archaeon]
MRHRAPTVLAMLLTAAFLPLLPGTAGAGPAAAEVPFELDGCSYVEPVVKVDPATVDPLVPDDFDLRVTADGFTTVNLGVAACASGRSGGDTGPGSFGFLLVRINAPADPVLRGQVDVWFYRLEQYTLPGDLYARAADAAGVDHTEVAVLEATVDQALSTLTIGGPGFAHRATVPVSPSLVPIEAAPVAWREFHAVEGGYATLEASLVPDPAGNSLPHVVQAQGGLAEQVLGAQNAGLANYGAAFAVHDGRMMVLPAP